ncbi:hypothetical protein [Bradyrhizobium sp. B117]|uniref:hypothetical protein n=1 Tax=Bradyrhizobium sp. B117 TaxID=3140246 RepID=UPI00318340C9
MIQLPSFPGNGYEILVASPYWSGGGSVTMPQEKEQESRRVTFEHPVPAQMMAIDGTWRRSCHLKVVSDMGATLQVEASIQGLVLTEFFLLLSSTGLAYRRCQLDRVNGDLLEISFLRQKAKAKKPPG